MQGFPSERIWMPLRKRIVVLACVIFIGTYVGSAAIAEVILKALGQI